MPGAALIASASFCRFLEAPLINFKHISILIVCQLNMSLQMAPNAFSMFYLIKPMGFPTPFWCVKSRYISFSTWFPPSLYVHLTSGYMRFRWKQGFLSFILISLWRIEFLILNSLSSDMLVFGLLVGNCLSEAFAPKELRGYKLRSISIQTF